MSIMIDKGNAAIQALPGIMNVIYNDTILGITLTPDNTFLLNLYAKGEFSNIGDLIKGSHKIATTMPAIAKDLQRRIVPIILATKYQGQGATAVKNLNTVLATDWSKKTGSQTVRNGFTSIQGYLKNQLLGELNTLNKVMKLVDDSLNLFPLRKNNIEWVVDSTSYARYIDTTYEMPCLEMKRAAWTLGQYREYKDYPTFYKCTPGLVHVNLPDSKVPAIKWRFVSNQK